MQQKILKRVQFMNFWLPALQRQFDTMLFMSAYYQN